MDEFIINIIHIIFIATSSDVCIFIEVALQMAINRGHYSISSNIKFPIMDQQRIVYVFLYDESPILSLWRVMSRLYYLFDVLQRGCNVYAISSVRIFSRLYNPNILFKSIFLLDLFHLLVLLISYVIRMSIFFLRVLSIFIVCLLLSNRSLLCDQLNLLQSSPLGPFLSFFMIYFSLPFIHSFGPLNIDDLDLLFQLIIVVFKYHELFICDSIFNKVGERENFKRIFPYIYIVVSHIYKYPLLICQLLILVYFAIHFDWLVQGVWTSILQVIYMILLLP